jgi:hypothetical protein
MDIAKKTSFSSDITSRPDGLALIKNSKADHIAFFPPMGIQYNKPSIKEWRESPLFLDSPFCSGEPYLRELIACVTPTGPLLQ